MKTPVLLAALLASASAAEALPLPRLGAELAPQVALAPAAETAGPGLELQLLPGAVLDELVRWQRGARDTLRAAEDALASLADQAGVRIPDVSVLVTDPVANSESSGFGWRDDPFRHRPKFHSGTDFRGKHGTPVLAAASGVVVFAGWQGGYGNILYVDHGGGVVTGYAHLSRFRVRVNDAVIAGQPIGAIGATGRVTGPHLHFEVRLDGHPVDPVMAMTVAQLGREAPLVGRIAAFALAPELQSSQLSAHDPPKQPVPSPRAKSSPGQAPAAAPPASRPDRPGRVKIAKPVS